MTTTHPLGQDALLRDECLTLLRSMYVGRVGYVTDGRPVIVPVNYRVDDEGAVFFFSGEGRKLQAATSNAVLCLEVDDADGLYKSGWSVLVTGAASVLSEAAASERARSLRLRPWDRGVGQTHLVRIAPDLVEGRKIRSG